jgi:hypothetical protein
VEASDSVRKRIGEGEKDGEKQIRPCERREFKVIIREFKIKVREFKTVVIFTTKWRSCQDGVAWEISEEKDKNSDISNRRK